MIAAERVLNANGIHLPSYAPGRRYTTCPQCSLGRATEAHRKAEVLGVRIDGGSVRWGCNHCGWTGPSKGNGNGGEGKPLTSYVYRDKGGEIRFRKVRNAPGREPRFFLQKWTSLEWAKGTSGVDTSILYRADELAKAIADGREVIVAEGEKDVDRLWALGFAATCNAHGASESDKKPKWVAGHSAQLAGADIVVLNDNDASGYAHADATCKLSLGVTKRVRRLDLKDHWPDIPKGGDVSDWLAQGHGREELAALIDGAPDYQGRTPEPEPEPSPPPTPTTLDEVVATFQKWLLLEDLGPVYAVLATVAANLLDGEPVWLGVIGPPSSAKTEILNALSRLPDVVAVGILTMSGLLSGTPKHQKDAGAKGGLLRQIGPFGILALKDFGSVLSMRQEARAELLGALREIYDGQWVRHLGADGGRTLSWKGKVGLIFCSTQAFDDERAPIAALGDRFIVCRLAPPAKGQLRKAMEHRGAALKTMREELAKAVAGLFVKVKGREPKPIDDDEITRLETIVALAVRLRGHVQRDRYSRDIENVHDPEGSSRVGLALERLLAGLDVIGLKREDAMKLVEEIALASTPPLRRHAFELLGDTPKTTRDIAVEIRISTSSSRRTLEDLVAQGLARRQRPPRRKKGETKTGDEKQGGADLWTRSPEGAALSESLQPSIDPSVAGYSPSGIPQPIDEAGEPRSRKISQAKEKDNRDFFSSSSSSVYPHSSAPSGGRSLSLSLSLSLSSVYFAGKWVARPKRRHWRGPGSIDAAGNHCPCGA